MADIILTPPVLPEGFCPEGEQARANAYFALAGATLPDEFTTVIVGPDTPTVDNQDKVFVRTDAFNAIVGVYTYYSGAWVKPHVIPPGPNDYRALWVGTLANLALFEGGAAGAITELTGAFWEQDTDWTDKVPKGAGVTAVSTNTTLLDVGTPTQDVRGVYIIKRSIRKYHTI